MLKRQLRRIAVSPWGTVDVSRRHTVVSRTPSNVHVQYYGHVNMTTLCIVTKQCPRTTWSQKHNTLRLCTKRWWHSHVKYQSSHTKQNVSTPHNVHISHGQVNVQLCVNNQTYNVLRTTSRKHWALCRCWSGLVAIFLNLGEGQKSHGSIQYKSHVSYLVTHKESECKPKLNVLNVYLMYYFFENGDWGLKSIWWLHSE